MIKGYEVKLGTLFDRDRFKPIQETVLKLNAIVIEICQAINADDDKAKANLQRNPLLRWTFIWSMRNIKELEAIINKCSRLETSVRQKKDLTNGSRFIWVAIFYQRNKERISFTLEINENGEVKFIE